VVENSILSSNVVVKKGAVVKDSNIMAGAVIGENSKISYSIIDEFACVGDNSTVGVPMAKRAKIAVLGRNYVLGDGSVVNGGEILDDQDE
jgi:ADP-glucose pyrophosphorylase